MFASSWYLMSLVNDENRMTFHLTDDALNTEREREKRERKSWQIQAAPAGDSLVSR